MLKQTSMHHDIYEIDPAPKDQQLSNERKMAKKEGGTLHKRGERTFIAYSEEAENALRDGEISLRELCEKAQKNGTSGKFYIFGGAIFFAKNG